VAIRLSDLMQQMAVEMALFMVLVGAAGEDMLVVMAEGMMVMGVMIVM